MRDVDQHLGENSFVSRSDVKSYDASIDHEILYAQLREHVNHQRLMDLLWQYMRRTISDGGLYEDVTVGIAAGLPTVPADGCPVLEADRRRDGRGGLFYARFMDDRVVLAPTRWKLRAAVAICQSAVGGVEG